MTEEEEDDEGREGGTRERPWAAEVSNRLRGRVLLLTKPRNNPSFHFWMTPPLLSFSLCSS